MHLFRNKYESHEHSLNTLELISVYDDFMDSITTIADMGCGSGLDITWFATLCDRDDPPRPYNYDCYAVDKDLSKMDKNLPPNVNLIQSDFSELILPKKMDLILSHDSLQFSINPLHTLKVWNKQMNVNGMLVIAVPQTMSMNHNKFTNTIYDGCYFNYNIGNLMYMLAVNGFDCRDSYFYKSSVDSWIYAAVYKSDIEPMDPSKTRWYDLVEKNLLNDSVVTSINKHGYLKQEDIMVTWLDRNYYVVN
jgi:trans-aconitate methyltransferase